MFGTGYITSSLKYVYVLQFILYSCADTNEPYERTVNLPDLLYNKSCSFYVIAHRGASHYAPENTMSAFKAAHEMGADMIELDVQLSSDGIPMVIHDADLKKTTDGDGFVFSYTAEKLRRLDAGSWYSEAFINEPIPFLEEVLEWAAGKIALNIEIKSESVVDETEIGVEQKVLDLVQRYEMDNHVLISSFDYRVFEHLKNLKARISTGLLYDRKEESGRSPEALVDEYQANAFHINWRWLNTRRMKRLNTAGIPVMAYTVNSERKMRQLIRYGVAGIFSDRPELLKKIADTEIESRCK